jgi:hypothetical protein
MWIKTIDELTADKLVQYSMLFTTIILFFFLSDLELLFWWYWSLNSGLRACETAALQLQSCLQPFCSGYFGDRVLLFA